MNKNTKLRKFGFWWESGYPMSSIYDYIDKSIKTNRKLDWFIFFYIVNSPRLSTAMSFQESIIDGNNINGEVIHTDGTWVWTEDIVYYYENNGLVFPEDFIKHIKSRMIPYPWFFKLKILLSNRKIIRRIDEILVNDFAEYTARVEESGVPPQEPAD